jgi:hypothetical protein
MGGELLLFVCVVGFGDRLLDDVNAIPLVYSTSVGDRKQNRRAGGEERRQDTSELEVVVLSTVSK